MSTALASAGYAGPVAVADGGAEWPYAVRARLGSLEAARSLARRLSEPLAPLRRIGLVGDMLVAPTDDVVPAAAREPVRVDERVVLRFGEDGPEQPDADVVVRVAPGLGFGSGLHPGTLLCLRLIARHARPGMDALDLGCGNGVASVVLAKLGARVTAVDNDPTAVAAAAETLRRNGVVEQVSLALGSLGRGGELGHWLGWGELAPAPPVDAAAGFDLIAANILSSVHVGLAPEYRAALRPNGIVVTAGYTAHQLADTSEALVEAGLEPIDEVREGEFVALAHRRPL